MQGKLGSESSLCVGITRRSSLESVRSEQHFGRWVGSEKAVKGRDSASSAVPDFS